VTTLLRYVAALGGELELVARFPGGVRLELLGSPNESADHDPAAKDDPPRAEGNLRLVAALLAGRSARRFGAC
jgi:hypothetical protein